MLTVEEDFFNDDKVFIKITLNSLHKVENTAASNVDLLHALIQKAEDYGVECDGQVEIVEKE